MQLIRRSYQPGDEIGINKLYKLITSRKRSIEEHRWEWIDTWWGQGSMWLAFDDDREEGDKLVMQYSLIPTPFSLWGTSYLAGKTENCMCHPDLRGKGQFFLHEKISFEEAKKKFNLFFTADGTVTSGTVGAVRRKIGYVALDAWAYYTFFLSPKYPYDLLYSRLEKRKVIPIAVAKFLAILMSNISAFYFKLFMPRKSSADIRICGKNNVALNDIENFWNRNKKHYMITVDRRSDYLAWRINQNPYFDYQYLLYYEDHQVKGYIIFSVRKNNTCVIEDILAENKDINVFNAMLSHLIAYAKKMGIDAVSCATLAENVILKSVFKKNKFLDLDAFRRFIERAEKLKAFYVYIAPGTESTQDPLNPQNWYVTDLLSEGRPYET